MLRSVLVSSLLLSVVVTVSSAMAQVATGTPPWSSLEGGPDVVNLGNLNVHLPYPVLHKAGRGLPLHYDLASDTSFWYPAVSGSTKFWNPVQTGGWSGSPQGVGDLYYATTTRGGWTCAACGTRVDKWGRELGGFPRLTAGYAFYSTLARHEPLLGLTTDLYLSGPGAILFCSPVLRRAVRPRGGSIKQETIRGTCAQTPACCLCSAFRFGVPGAN